MISHAVSHTPSAPAFYRKPRAIATPIIDLATARELRRTTDGGRNKRRRRGRTTPAPDLSCPPTIRTLPVDPSEPEEPPPSSVMILNESEACGQISALRAQWIAVRHELDATWFTALALAVTVTLALALPLEIFRQHG